MSTPSISGGTLPPGVTEAAVMQSLSECKYLSGFDRYQGGGRTLSDFLSYCEQQEGADRDPDVQILRDYLNDYRQAGSYEILDVAPGDGAVGNKVLVCGQQADGSKTYYVGFQGTQNDEWLDNAEGMVQTSTLQQQDAADYFDEMVRREGITDQDTVIVTGHSKGGNKAQYVTLASENADLVDSCIALDGQGFSPEAVDMWEKYPEVYEARREKIVLVAGENDYVHVLGERVAKEENTYYVSYGPQDNLGIKDRVESYHAHQYLFQNTWDEEKQCYVFSSRLQEPSGQSEFSRQVQDINDYLMSLPPEERLSASATVMSVMSGESLDGYTPGMTDIISMLNTLYELLDYKLGTWDDIMVGKYANPTYAVMKTIQKMIRGLENLRNEWEEVRAQRARASARSMAESEPYIYIDTAVWDQLGSTMRTLGDVNYAGIRRELASIRNELGDILSSVAKVLLEANEAIDAAMATGFKAEQAILDFEAGNLIGGMFATVEAAMYAVETAKQTVELVKALIREAINIYNSLEEAVTTMAQAIALLGVEDTVRELGDYLSATAQEFELAERSNIYMLQKLGV